MQFWRKKVFMSRYHSQLPVTVILILFSKCNDAFHPNSTPTVTFNVQNMVWSNLLNVKSDYDILLHCLMAELLSLKRSLEEWRLCEAAEGRKSFVSDQAPSSVFYLVTKELSSSNQSGYVEHTSGSEGAANYREAAETNHTKDVLWITSTKLKNMFYAIFQG